MRKAKADQKNQTGENVGGKGKGDEGKGKLLTLNQAADFLKVSKPTLYRLLEQGKVKGRKAGNQWRFKQDELVAYLDRGPVSTVYADVPRTELEEEFAFLNAELRKLGTSSRDLPDDASEEERINIFVEGLLRLGCFSRASDIHLEAFLDDRETFYVLRLRIDGVMHEVRRYSPALAAGVFARFKTWMCMDLSERRPQDGRIKVGFDQRSFDLRGSFVPTVLGESAVFRILDPGNIILGLENLGLTNNQQKVIRGWTGQTHGLILVTGPTGSGKTTLVYSMLQELARPERKTMTVESPVELVLPWTTQIQETQEIGLTYPAAIRSLLRQDPDVILVGEIRDLDSLHLALKSALTGHLVITVLHSGDTISALMRMIQMGVEPFMVTSALMGVVATRLVRKICPACSGPAMISREAYAAQMADLAGKHGFVVPKKPILAVGKGCKDCHGHGYRGREGLFEVLDFQPVLKDALLKGSSRAEMERLALAEGLVTLLGDGLRKAAEGTTTLQEVFRIFT